jgi:hypothetical protein
MLHIVFILLVMFVCLVTMQVHCLQLMLCLFRRKMFFIIKYFQRNYFSEKMIFLKIFSSVWLVRKKHNSKKSPTAICVGFWPVWSEFGLAKFRRIWLYLPDLLESELIRFQRMWPEFGYLPKFGQ